MGDYSTVSIPKELKENVEELIADTGFSNVSEFTKFVLRDIVSQGAFDGPEEFTAIQEKVRERLKNLGYLDDQDGRRSQQRRGGDVDPDQEE